MTPEARTKLKNLLVQHEGMKLFPYLDTTGHMTIGVGRNLSDRGISNNEAMYLLEDDIKFFTDKLRRFLDVFDDLSEARQICLVDMCFNLGLKGFLAFTKMISALNRHNYIEAANEMLESRWAGQVGERALKLANIMRTGEL